MFHLISGAAMALSAVYLFWRCIAPLRISWAWKCCLSVLCVAGAFKLQIFRYIFRDSLIQDLPFSVHVLAGWLAAAVILLTLLCLLTDAVLLLRRLWHKVRGTQYSACNPQVRVAALALVASLLTSYSVWEAVRVPDVKEVELRFADLPPDLDGLRLVQLSDLHISTLFREDWVRGVVQKVNDLKPDLVLLTGDLMDGSVALRGKSVEPLRSLRARFGVYGCHGNHEYFSGMPEWHEALQGLGLRILRNEHVALQVGDTTLVVGGITDKGGAYRYRMEMPDAGKAFAGSPEGWRLLLAHQPAWAERHRDAAEPQLQLSGHTHGGQLFPISLFVGGFNEGYLAGEYQVGSMRLYVSRGVGLWAGFPVRLGAPSEITHITLRRGEAMAAPAD